MNFEHVSTLAKLNEIVESMPHPVITQWDCYRSAVNTFEGTCDRFTDATLTYTKLLAQRCQVLGSKFSGALLLKRIQTEVESACSIAEEF